MDEIARCRDWIAAALAYSGGTHTPEDVAGGILAGTLQLWPAEKGCLVTEIVDFPRKRVLNIFLAAGDMRQVLDMNDDVAAWAKAQGCTAMTAYGRKGWERVARRFGWTSPHTFISKEI